MRDEKWDKAVEVDSSVDKVIECGFCRTGSVELANRVKSFKRTAGEFCLMLERIFGRHNGRGERKRAHGRVMSACLRRNYFED